VLACAITKTWHQPGDGLYESMQRLFGRWQGWTWWAVRRAAAIAPRTMTRAMMQQFTSRDLDEAMAQLSDADLELVRRLIFRSAAGRGFLADLEHRVPDDLLRAVQAETLIVHSRFDGAVPFDHATHAAQCIPNARTFEAPTLGHLLWVGPGRAAADQAIADFLGSSPDDTELARRPT
jgi:pimeloyl-ACP methyl ester carboxylesterase